MMANPMEIEALNEAARRCAQAGFIHYELPRYSNEIDTIYLVDAQIETIESLSEGALRLSF